MSDMTEEKEGEAKERSEGGGRAGGRVDLVLLSGGDEASVRRLLRRLPPLHAVASNLTLRRPVLRSAAAHHVVEQHTRQEAHGLIPTKLT
jgi:hypothetical protein